MTGSKRKTYKWVVNCDITVIACNKEMAIEKIKSQLGAVDYGGFEENPERIGSPEVEQYSKYNKFGKCRRVKFYEGN